MRGLLIPLLFLPSLLSEPPREKAFLQALNEGVKRTAAGKEKDSLSLYADLERKIRARGGPKGWLSLVNVYRRIGRKEAERILAARKEFLRVAAAYRAGKVRSGDGADLLERALGCKAPVFRIEVRNLRALILTFFSNFARARPLYEQAAGEAGKYGLIALKTAILANLARQALAEADYEGALKILEGALKHSGRAGDPCLEALLHYHMASALAGLGRTGECLARLERAARLYKEGGDPDRAFQVSVDRVRVLLDAGRRSLGAVEAERLLASPLAPKSGGNKIAAASLLVSFLAGGGPGADKRLAALADEADRAGRLEYKLGFLLYRLRLARRGKAFAKASRILLEAEETAERIGGAWARCRVLLARARLLKRMGRLDEARRKFLALARPGRSRVPRIFRSMALEGLAGLSAREGRSGEAAGFLVKAARLESKGGNLFRRVDLLARAAGRYFAAGKAEEGRRLARLALDLLPRARRRAWSWTAGLQVLGRKAKIFQFLLDGILAGEEGDPSRPAAFSLAEKLKAGGLYDRILRMERGGGKGPRPYHMLAALEERIRTLKETGGDPALIRSLQLRKTELLNIRSLPEPGGGALRTVSLAELRRALPSSVTVFFFHLGPARSALWRVERGSVSFRPLPGKAELLKNVSRFREVLSSRPGYGAWRAVWREGRRALRVLMGGLVRDLRPGTRAVVVPGEGLEDFPFSAMVAGPETMPSRQEEIRYLGPDLGVAFTRIPSATLLVHYLEKKPILSLGGKALLAGGRGHFLPPGGARELRLLAGLLAGREVIQARGKAVPSVLGGKGRVFSLLHLACHGGEAGNPPWPALFLEKGCWLTPLQVLAWGLGPDLVNLAACRTGAGRSLPLEGRMGFARAFLACGSRNVLVSSWEVQDEGAERFNACFYRNLGKGPAGALLAAQRTLRRNPVFSSPFYWGPFQLIGLP